MMLLKGSLDSTLMGLALLQAFDGTQMLGFVLLQMNEVEVRMNAMERINYFIQKNPKEKEFKTPKAPENWPSEGKVEINHLFLRHRPGLENVVHDFSFQIRPQEKVNFNSETIKQ